MTEGGWSLEFGFLSGIGAIALEVVYIYIAIAAIFYFKRIMGSKYSAFKHLIVPIIAILGPLAALWGSIQPQGGLLNAMPYVVVAWIIIGIVLIAGLRSSNPDLVAKLGRDLGVEL
jgi:hypothetical protein